MKKAIKITEANAAAIVDALKDANGKNREHTYNSYLAIAELAVSAEQQLEKLGIAKARRAGAAMSAISGDKMPNSYKYSRTGTWVCLERRSSDWYLVRASAKNLFKEGGCNMLTMTKAQDEEAVANFRKQYVVQA